MIEMRFEFLKKKKKSTKIKISSRKASAGWFIIRKSLNHKNKKTVITCVLD